METRPALAVHQAVQMNIQIGGGAEALDERDRARVGLAAFQFRLASMSASGSMRICVESRKSI